MTTTVGEYLLTRLKQLGIDHVFGVPGDFALGFNKLIEDSKIVQWVGTCNELNAGYAADGYARIKGIGAMVVTYAVGELSALNAIAGAFSERVPVVIITGSPTVKDQIKQPLLHHTLGDYQIPKKLFESITVANTVLVDPETAPRDIDRTLEKCITNQAPVYISLPCDNVHKRCQKPSQDWSPSFEVKSNESALNEALDEATKMIDQSKLPIILADVELLRYRMQKEFENLINKTEIPYATLMMGKSILDEDHKQFIGLYSGAVSRDYVKNRCENADVVLQLGTWLTDLNTGGFTINIDPSKTISVHHSRVQIRYHIYDNVGMKSFINGLSSRLQRRDPSSLQIKPASQGCIHRSSNEFRPDHSKLMTNERLFNRISHFIPQNSIVVAETGNSLFSAAETMLPKGSTFIGQVFYSSIGYSLGAALGASIAAPNRKVMLFIGDGSFQVTLPDLSTMIRNHCNITVILLNNDGYSIERAIVDGKFNDLQPWKYHMLPNVFGGRPGFDVRTEGDFENALNQIQNMKELSFAEIHLERFDVSEALKKAGTFMREKSQA